MKFEAGILKRFYKHNPVEEIMSMSDEELDKRINEYLDKYIKSQLKKDPNWNFPTIPTSSINDVRNKRTGGNKNPKIARTK